MKLFLPSSRLDRESGGAVRVIRAVCLPIGLLILLVLCSSEGWAQFLASHADRPTRDAAPFDDVAEEPQAIDTKDPIRLRDAVVVDSNSYDWMHFGQLTPPTRHVSEATRVDSTFVRQDVLEILEMRLQFNERPPYARERYHEFIDARPRRRSCRTRAFRRLAHKQFYRHLRRLLKKQWRRDFRDSAWSYDDYLDGVTQINRFGREGGDSNEINAEYFYNTARNDTLSDSDLEGERESVIVRYGPVGLTDEGQIDFDLRSFLSPRSERADLEIDPVENEDDALTRRVGLAVDPLFTGRCVKIRPKLKLRVDPFRAIGDHPERVLRSYGGSLDVSFYSDITKRKLFSIEAEAKMRREEWGCFVNFVIDGWR